MFGLIGGIGLWNISCIDVFIHFQETVMLADQNRYQIPNTSMMKLNPRLSSIVLIWFVRKMMFKFAGALL